MKLMSVEVRGKPPNLRKAMQTKVINRVPVSRCHAECHSPYCLQINLYREELQGLLRDLERAQLMARETKSAAQASGANSVRVSGGEVPYHTALLNMDHLYVVGRSVRPHPAQHEPSAQVRDAVALSAWESGHLTHTRFCISIQDPPRPLRAPSESSRRRKRSGSL